MNKTPKEAAEFCKLMKEKVVSDAVEVVFCVPFVDLYPERQGMLARYTERCIEVRFYQFGFPVHPAYACGASAVLSTAAAVFFFFPRFSVEISPAFASASFVSTGPVSS